MFKDNVSTFRGHFSILTKDIHGNLVDEYKDDNLIVNNARLTMANLVGGRNGASGGHDINEFRMGTRGYHNADQNDNIMPGESDGIYVFDQNRTQLISMETLERNYGIVFDVTSTSNPKASNPLSGQTFNGDTPYLGTDSDALMIVTRTTNDGEYSVNFNIIIPTSCGNNPDGGSVIYTEACLFANTATSTASASRGTNMFAMKTFPGRTKDSSHSFEINWKIYF